jgi:hypothetical protein
MRAVNRTAEREELALKIANGLSGYFQYVNATQLLSIPGEDTAQFVMCQILQAQQKFRIKVSAQPPNWSGAYRVDAALLGRAKGAEGWYGVAEIKWITSSVQPEVARQQILRDCARVASVTTSNLNAKFVVVGFTDDMLRKVFDQPHQPGSDLERQRLLFAKLLRQVTPSRSASTSHADLIGQGLFPDYQSRVPANAIFETGLEAQLLARSSIKASTGSAGEVLVWQANKRRGNTPL